MLTGDNTSAPALAVRLLVELLPVRVGHVEFEHHDAARVAAHDEVVLAAASEPERLDAPDGPKNFSGMDADHLLGVLVELEQLEPPTPSHHAYLLLAGPAEVANDRLGDARGREQREVVQVNHPGRDERSLRKACPLNLPSTSLSLRCLATCLALVENGWKAEEKRDLAYTSIQGTNSI